MCHLNNELLEKVRSISFLTFILLI